MLVMLGLVAHTAQGIAGDLSQIAEARQWRTEHNAEFCRNETATYLECLCDEHGWPLQILADRDPGVVCLLTN